MVWQTHRGYRLVMVVLRFGRAFVPVATLWTGKLIIDAVVASASERLWKLVALEIAIVTTGELLARASSLTESLLSDLFGNVTSVRLMEHAATLDLYQFEDPSFYDQLERARRQTTGRIGMLAQLLSMGQDAITLVFPGRCAFWPTALGCRCGWPWRSFPAFLEKRISRRLNTHCFIAGRPSGVSWITCAFWGRAIERRRKCRCLALRSLVD
ncbi:MAG: hypothetical protein WKF84_25595 [Pyrinomonadaceae bacterium]